MWREESALLTSGILGYTPGDRMAYIPHGPEVVGRPDIEDIRVSEWILGK